VAINLTEEERTKRQAIVEEKLKARRLAEEEALNRKKEEK